MVPTLVTVVTPSFNQGVFIERTLESVFLQRCDEIEIEHLVFDGGSTDCTVNVLKEWSQEIAWTSERDKGQADAVNKGLHAARGEIIGWLNSDDVYYPGAIASAVSYLRAHPDVDVVYGQADHIDVDDRPFEEYPTESWNFQRLIETCFICQPAAFFRRTVVERHGALDATLNYCMDYEYWLRLGRVGVRFGYLEEKLAGSRLYADTKTLGSRVRVHAEINDMFHREFGHVPDKWLFAYAHAFCFRRYGAAINPRFFSQQFALRSWSAALKWNGRISSKMWRMTREWIGLLGKESRAIGAQATGVSRDDVIGAYRILLGREPENEGVIQGHMREASFAELREKILRSDEFQRQI